MMLRRLLDSFEQTLSDTYITPYVVTISFPIAEQQECAYLTPLDFARLGKIQSFKVAVGPKRSTNRNLKQIITIECTKTVIFQLLRPLDISKFAKRELTQ